MDPTHVELARRLWDYHQLHQEVTPADAIFVLCSHDLIVAERGAELYRDGLAPLVIISGGSGAITRDLFDEPEAEIFARIAVDHGVPGERILLETESTNTGQNVAFTRRLLAARGLAPRSFILVQKPYMERRAYATFRKVWPDMPVQVTSPRIGFAEYLERYAHDALSADDVVSIMVGDLQRIRVYPSRGFQIEQPIPDEVWAAFEALVAAGFNKHLVA